METQGCWEDSLSVEPAQFIQGDSGREIGDRRAQLHLPQLGLVFFPLPLLTGEDPG